METNLIKASKQALNMASGPKVGSLGAWHDGTWSWNLEFNLPRLSVASCLEWEVIHNILLNVHLTLVSSDPFIWWHDSAGFSLKVAYSRLLFISSLGPQHNSSISHDLQLIWKQVSLATFKSLHRGSS
ncbi:hypothetical protein KIW84_043489 [Lathyrus oleraceus]|uniref:Uncharacterized protein n=1 Tax=Pisum sativum TaxID=3888 RepID=A0A9D4XFC6_PEA|nr:hypothetical protein KIW84_043489 [Pisum sativum]